MGVVVQPDFAKFSARYPELAYIGAPLYGEYFEEAGLYQRNDGGGPIALATTQLLLLNMMTAHIAAMNAASNPSLSGGVAQPSSPLVGRLSSATEGSVTVSTENNYPPGTVQWYQQTKYGSAWYAATAAYRTMRYIPGPGARNTFGQYPIGGNFWPW